MSMLNSSPTNKQCGYCNRTLLRVAARQAFAPDPMWKHAQPAVVCTYCDRTEELSA